MQLSADITRWLIEWNNGDEAAVERIVVFVYDELRRLAANYLRDERPDHTLEATALVHEAYLQLQDMHGIEWKNRAHFIGTAAQAMRRILVDHARKHNAVKRGGGNYKVPISRVERLVAEPEVNLVALDEALEKLTANYPRQAKIVELRFFGGLSPEETVKILKASGTDVSLRTVERDWRFAKAWLHGEINNR